MKQEQIETNSSSSFSPSIVNDDKNDESKMKSLEMSSKFPLTAWEMAGAAGVVFAFAVGLLGVYLTLPDSDYSFLKLPKTLEDLHILRYLLSPFNKSNPLRVTILDPFNFQQFIILLHIPCLISKHVSLH